MIRVSIHMKAFEVNTMIKTVTDTRAMADTTVKAGTTVKADTTVRADIKAKDMAISAKIYPTNMEMVIMVTVNNVVMAKMIQDLMDHGINSVNNSVKKNFILLNI